MLMFRAFFLGFDIAYSFVLLKETLFPLFLSPFHSFFLPLKTQSLAFSGVVEGVCLAFCSRGSLVVQEAQVATAKSW